MKPFEKWILLADWLTRIVAVVFFLLWGAFFLEHLFEWFLNRKDPAFPPLHVWVAQFGHLLLLVGYAAGLGWKRAGAIIVLAGAAIFFAAVPDAVILLMLLVSCLPAVAWLILSRRQPARPDNL